VPLLGFGLAALVGLSLGLLGAGGSILTVPVLAYVLDFDPKQAVPMSLVIVGMTSLAGALARIRRRQVRLRSALTFAPVAMVGAYVGARLAMFVSGATQLTVLGLAMLGAAISMFRGAGRERDTVRQALEPRPALVGIVALTIGALTGFAGVGGGFLFVPALTLLAGLPMHQAIGTSLVVITLNSAAALVGYVGHVDLPWPFLTTFTLVAIAGVAIGTRFVRSVSQPMLRRAFAVLLVATSIFVLYRNRTVFTAAGASSVALAHERYSGK
jgi:hypothetical protein